MATRSKAPKNQKATDSRQKAVSSESEQQTRDESASPTGNGPAPGDKSAPAIRKGVYLSALIYVEGEQPAPEDFTATARAALKEVLGEALKGEHGGLSMSLKKFEVRNDVEQEDGEDTGEEKFQF